MASNTTSNHDPAELGELERGILGIVWRLGEATADRVREEVDRPLKDSTIRTVLPGTASARCSAWMQSWHSAA